MTQTESIFARKPTGRGVFQIEPMHPRRAKPKNPNFIDHLFDLHAAPVRICDEPDPTFRGSLISWDVFLSIKADYELKHGSIV